MSTKYARVTLTLDLEIYPERLGTDQLGAEEELTSDSLGTLVEGIAQNLHVNVASHQAKFAEVVHEEVQEASVIDSAQRN
jgi:hypothetical protein